MGSHTLRKHMHTYFDYHDCISCNLYCSVFECVVKTCPKPASLYTMNHSFPKQPAIFPPTLLDSKLSHQIINNFCADSTPTVLEEAGCAVCGRLTHINELTKLTSVKNLLHILNVSGVTRLEHTKASDKLKNAKDQYLTTLVIMSVVSADVICVQPKFPLMH